MDPKILAWKSGVLKLRLERLVALREFFDPQTDNELLDQLLNRLEWRKITRRPYPKDKPK